MVARRNYLDNMSDDKLIGKIGFDSPVVVDKHQNRRVLITGSGSFIGESFRKYATNYYHDNFVIDTLDMLDNKWSEFDFTVYDIVFHVAGIAHVDVGNVTDDVKETYYKVNTDLAIEVCTKAKESGVKTFIFMSSMIVYGDSAGYSKVKVVDANTIPNPSNFYGDSKLQADVAVRMMADVNFQVVVLRPPMIYGKGSKGNYPLLSRIAGKAPLFPNVKNERSMLYIENMCEFLCQIMLVDADYEAIVMMPQNSTYTRTSDMVSIIAEVNGHKLILTSVLNPFVCIGSKLPGKIGRLVNKAFGNLVYDESVSEYAGINYQRIDMQHSIELTES